MTSANPHLSGDFPGIQLSAHLCVKQSQLSNMSSLLQRLSLCISQLTLRLHLYSSSHGQGIGGMACEAGLALSAFCSLCSGFTLSSTFVKVGWEQEVRGRAVEGSTVIISEVF